MGNRSVEIQGDLLTRLHRTEILHGLGDCMLVCAVDKASRRAHRCVLAHESVYFRARARFCEATGESMKTDTQDEFHVGGHACRSR